MEYTNSPFSGRRSGCEVRQVLRFIPGPSHCTGEPDDAGPGGCRAGFAGDRLVAALERADLHYLVFECLGQRATSRAGAVDPCMASAAIGDSAPGTTGVLMLTRDSGDTWQRVDMPVEPDSAMWVVRQRPDTPNLVLAASRYGYLYRSDDRGQS